MMLVCLELTIALEIVTSWANNSPILHINSCSGFNPYKLEVCIPRM